VQDLPGAEPARGWRRFAAIEQAVAPGPGEEPPPLWQAARGGRRQAAAMSGRVEDQA
jgi:hypothetical protein